MLERADLPQMRSTVLADASALNSVLAFRAVPYVFCSADRTKSGSRVRALKAKRYSRLSSLSIPIPSRVARDAIGFSPQAIQFFANCMYHYAVVHLGPPRREIRLPRIRTTPLGTMRITPLFLSLEAFGWRPQCEAKEIGTHATLAVCAYCRPEVPATPSERPQCLPFNHSSNSQLPRL